MLASFLAYDASFLGGVNVAPGDVNGDGRDDIIVGPQANGPAHIRAFTADGQLLVSFYAFAPSFVSGAKVASADVNHDGRAEIVVAAGRGEQAGHVIVFRRPDAQCAIEFLGVRSQLRR